MGSVATGMGSDEGSNMGSVGAGMGSDGGSNTGSVATGMGSDGGSAIFIIYIINIKKERDILYLY